MDKAKWENLKGIFLSEDDGKNDSSGDTVSTYFSLLKKDGISWNIYRLLSRRGSMSAYDISTSLNVDIKAIIKKASEMESDGIIGSRILAGGRFYFIGSGGFENYSRRYFDGPRIPLPQQFNLLCDSDRINLFSEAIDRIVTYDDIVLDLGSGNGILSLLAARKAKKVVSVEIDPDILDYSKRAFEMSGYGNRIVPIGADARRVNLPFKPTVIICEMLDTGLIAESQIEVMNYAIKNLVGKNIRVIPQSAKNFLQLVNADFNFLGYEMPMPYFEDNNTRLPKSILSEKKLYSTVNFSEINNVFLDMEAEIEVKKDGVLNAVRITTDLILSDDIISCGSPWLNPPLVFPVKKSDVRKGDIITVNLSYKYGEGIEKALVEVI